MLFIILANSYSKTCENTLNIYISTPNFDIFNSTQFKLHNLRQFIIKKKKILFKHKLRSFHSWGITVSYYKNLHWSIIKFQNFVLQLLMSYIHTYSYIYIKITIYKGIIYIPGSNTKIMITSIPSSLLCCFIRLFTCDSNKKLSLSHWLSGAQLKEKNKLNSN